MVTSSSKRVSLNKRTIQFLVYSISLIVISIIVSLCLVIQTMNKVREDTTNINNARLQVHDLSVRYYEQLIFRDSILIKIFVTPDEANLDMDLVVYENLYNKIMEGINTFIISIFPINQNI